MEIDKPASSNSDHDSVYIEGPASELGLPLQEKQKSEFAEYLGRNHPPIKVIDYQIVQAEDHVGTP